MVKTVIWNRRAVTNFNRIIKYLNEDWGENVTRDFVSRVYKAIELLAIYPEIGGVEDVNRGIRGFILTKHNTLFYRVENEKIVLLAFFDNRQNPAKKNL